MIYERNNKIRELFKNDFSNSCLVKNRRMTYFRFMEAEAGHLLSGLEMEGMEIIAA